MHTLCRWWLLCVTLAVLTVRVLAVPPTAPALPLRYLKADSEPPGPSTRRGALVVSEIHYQPAARTDGRNLQFIELFNSQVFFENISGWSLRGAIDFTFPTNTILPALGYLVVAGNPEDLRSAYPQLANPGAAPILGPFRDLADLPNDSGQILLVNHLGAVMFETEYQDRMPWPIGPDGGGPSLVLARPSLGERDPAAWGASEAMGGSPGGPEPPRTEASQSALVINEILAQSQGILGPTSIPAPNEDFVEIYNYSENPVDLSGCILTDDPSTNRFVIPVGTSIAARGFFAWEQDTLGFGLKSRGESLFFYSSNRSRLLDAIRFDPQELGIAWGRTPDGAPRFSKLKSHSFNAANAQPRLGEVVLNEIMYHPSSERDEDQFVELHNVTDHAIDLAGWELGEGIRYRFPVSAKIPPGEFVVVAKDLASLSNNYPASRRDNWFGNFAGRLSGSGERITLERPSILVETNALGIVITNRLMVVVDEVTYGTGGRWGRWADGGGSSLERRDPRADGGLASNWGDSDESAKSPWVTLRSVGPADNGQGQANLFQILAQGAGEYLIDNVVVQVGNGTNRIVNSSFSTGTTGWTIQGNHFGSRWNSSGAEDGSGCLQLSATGPGTTGPNRVFTTIANTTSGSVTLQARVRWLRGAPTLLLRLRGSYAEAVGPVLAAKNLGSPGATNSLFNPLPVPHIAEVSHFPVLPRNAQSTRITARVTDTVDLESVTLRYHSETVTNIYQELPMSAAGAGWFSSEISGLSGFQQFHIVASNRLGGVMRFPSDAPNRECNIRFGDPLLGGNLGHYRLWVSRNNVSRWVSRHPLSNDPFDTTFVLGNFRVIYNAGSYYSGSPFHAPAYNTPTGNNCDYSVVLPPDDTLMGETELNLLQPGNGGGDSTGQGEQQAYWMARQIGLPYCHRRSVIVWFNGVRRGVVYDDAQQPNGDFLRQWSPDDSTELHKIQLWFEFNADGRTFEQIGASLGNFLSQGRKKVARYRWNWPHRSYGNDPNNFTNFFRLVDAANTPTANAEVYTRALEQATDVTQWYRTHVIEHLVGNSDSFSYGGGQNMYTFKPSQGPWQLLIWDIDFAFAAANPTSDMVGIGGTDHGPVNTHPPFSRKYYQTMLDALRGPLDTNMFSAIIDARYNGLRANGASVSSPNAIKTFLRSRRSYVQRLITNNPTTLNFSPNLTNGVYSQGNLVTLSGLAPLEARWLTLNGEILPVTWTSRTGWRARVSVPSGTNVVVLSAIDGLGQVVSNSPVNLPIVISGTIEQPEGRVIFSEIYASPEDRDELAWIELSNTSTTTTYNLSEWRIEGIDYTIPSGTILTNGGRCIIPAHRYLFNDRYGPQLPVLDPFFGRLNPDGETLRIVLPGQAPELDRIVSEVHFRRGAPWPEAGLGLSLQLVDSAQDIRRGINWNTLGFSTLVGATTPGTSNRLATRLPPIPALCLNEVMPQNRTTLRDNRGRFGAWVEIYNASTSLQSLADCYLSPNPTNLTVWRFPQGAGIPGHGFLTVWLDGDESVSTDASPHTNFKISDSGTLYFNTTLRGRTGALDQIEFHTPGADISVGDYPDGDLLRRFVLRTPTPGAANTLAGARVQVFFNEWMADNDSFLADPVDGDFEDWFELYNAGPKEVRLEGFRLNQALESPTAFVIPAGYVLPSGGHLLVWADGEPNQNNTNRETLHVDFKLNRSGDGLVLRDSAGGLIDAVTFGAQRPDQSQGREPDGGRAIGFLNTPTPAMANPEPSVAALIMPPKISEIPGGNWSLQFRGSPGRRYQLQRREAFSDSAPTWESLEIVRTDLQGLGTFQLLPPGDSSSQFFRIVAMIGD